MSVTTDFNDVLTACRCAELLPHPAIPTIERCEDSLVLCGYDDCVILQSEPTGGYTLMSKGAALFGCQGVSLGTAVLGAIEHLSAPMCQYAVPVDQALARVKKGGLHVRAAMGGILVTRPFEDGVWAVTRDESHPWLWHVVGPVESDEFPPQSMPWEHVEEVLGISEAPKYHRITEWRPTKNLVWAVGAR